MTDTNTPQPSETVSQQQPPAPASPQRRTRAKSETEPRKLSGFLKVSIGMLIVITLLAIVMLFVDQIDAKFERVFATFLLFVIFSVFTAVDTSRHRVAEWYAPVALIANSYILAILLAVIWMTPNHSLLLMEFFWKSLIVIFVVRLVLILSEVLMTVADRAGETVLRFAFISSALAVLSGIMFTAPLGVEAFGLSIPDLYWRIAVSILILTALGLSVTLLLRWAYSSDERARRRQQAFEAQHFAQQQAAAYRAAQAQQVGIPGVPAVPVAQVIPGAPVLPAVPVQPAAPAAPAAPSFAAPTTPAVESEPVVPTAHVAAVAIELEVERQASAPEGLLPWPRYADGSPLPIGPDGQPDFSAQQRKH